MRTAIITGVSRGLGRALLPLALARFDRVLAIGRAVPPDVASPKLFHIRCDLADHADWHRILAKELPLQEDDEVVLIDNAAILDMLEIRQKAFEEKLETALRVNVLASAAISSALLNLTTRSGTRLSIIHIGTGASKRPIAGWGCYCISKAAAAMLHAMISAEHPDVKVLQIDPGAVDTDMQAQIKASTISASDSDDTRRLRNSMTKFEHPEIVAARIFSEAGL
jgi:benzil reductase ((S)-benzoin forming)